MAGVTVTGYRADGVLHLRVVGEAQCLCGFPVPEEVRAVEYDVMDFSMRVCRRCDDEEGKLMRKWSAGFGARRERPKKR